MTRPVVYTSIPTCESALLDEAGRYGIADLHEALGTVVGRLQLMRPEMRSIVPGLKAVGQAVTALAYPGDNLMMHQALSLAKAGQVLVVTNGGGSNGALWGDMAATYARKKGLAGVVMDGPVRDVDSLTAMKFPVWATSVSPSHSEKAGPGAVNIPVVVSGVLVNPGDVIVADGDGVLAIPLAYLAVAVEGARKRASGEKATRDRLAKGDPLFAPEALKAALERVGAVVHEGAWVDHARNAN
jgi:4-hydroxy-4-methyl-2-oxoglutarate aldolase